jgi:hypothetical protein
MTALDLVEEENDNVKKKAAPSATRILTLFEYGGTNGRE